MTEEICKLAVQQNGYVLEYIKQELMTDEICKLAVQQNGQVITICKIIIQNSRFNN